MSNTERGNQTKLEAGVTAKSVSDNWEQAKEEWVPVSVFRNPKIKKCVCGHRPIINLCKIRNKLNGNELVVGNHCIKYFHHGYDFDWVFRETMVLVDERQRMPSNEFLIWLFPRLSLPSKDREFLLSLMRKRARYKRRLYISEAQREWLGDINTKILAWFNNDEGENPVGSTLSTQETLSAMMKIIRKAKQNDNGK